MRGTPPPFFTTHIVELHERLVYRHLQVASRYYYPMPTHFAASMSNLHCKDAALPERIAGTGGYSHGRGEWLVILKKGEREKDAVLAEHSACFGGYFRECCEGLVILDKKRKQLCLNVSLAKNALMVWWLLSWIGDRRVTALLHTCCCTLVAVHTCGGAQVTGALRLSGEQQGADIAMIVLGGIAGAVMVMHCVMAVWDTTELALETEKLKRQPKKGPLCNAV
eukprot:1139726-Pelagomonas_calceolata.AAC.5